MLVKGIKECHSDREGEKRVEERERKGGALFLQNYNTENKSQKPFFKSMSLWKLGEKIGEGGGWVKNTDKRENRVGSITTLPNLYCEICGICSLL